MEMRSISRERRLWQITLLLDAFEFPPDDEDRVVVAMVNTVLSNPGCLTVH